MPPDLHTPQDANRVLPEVKKLFSLALPFRKIGNQIQEELQRMVMMDRIHVLHN